MKRKALGMAAVLVILCVGQGLFAQDENPVNENPVNVKPANEKPGLEVSGVLRTGITVHFTDRVDEGPFIYSGSNEKAEGTYFLLKASWSNRSKTFGVDSGTIFKFTSVNTVSTDQSYSLEGNIKMDNTFAWVRFLNGIFSIYGGAGEWEYGDPFKTPGPVDSNLLMEGLGMVLISQPLVKFDGHDLKLGFSVWTKGSSLTLINEAKYIFHTAYTMQDLFNVVANFAYRQYGPKGYADEEDVNAWDAQKAKDHRVNFGLNFTGLSKFGFQKMAADLEVRDLGGGRNAIRNPIQEVNASYDYLREAVVYPFYLGQAITWENFGLRLNLAFNQLLRLGDEHDDYAPALKFLFDASYRINDFVIPKAGVFYVMNSRAFGDYALDLRWNEGLDIEQCEKDTGALGFMVGFEFRPGGGSRSVIEVGYGLKKDMSKDVEATPRKSTLDHGVYASMSVSF